ncbi:MAG: amidohydrolase family protein [Alphaproteobacteria bacterium]|jgi:cytosine/adenosine deaminase-related metal-dependent hydrolase|nr:amidohydrolase family protein [Alphaproteobacteria bacterium]
MAVTHFKNVDWIVAWDESRDSHAYLRGGDLVFADNEITFVGHGYDGDSDEVIEGNGRCLIPGLVNIHTPGCTEVLYRGIREDHSVRAHYMTGLYERSCAFSADPEDLKHSVQVSYSDLMMSGVTTLVDVTYPYPGWLDVIAQSGLRMYGAPTFNTSRWQLPNGHELGFIEDLPKGKKDYEAALASIEELRAHPSGRLSGILAPGQIENVTPDLLRESRQMARQLGIPWTTHAAQAVVEFHIMVRRHGITPIQFLAEMGTLGDGTIIAHAIFIDQNSWIGWHTSTDLGLLGDSGTAVAHCPTPFMRYGAILEHFGRYKDAGVVLGIGTDTIPHNLIEDMRSAAILGRVASHDGHVATTSDVFHAATVGGARALMRDDIGRLAVGAKADLAVLDLTNPVMMPVRDPLVGLIHHAAERAVRDVYIDGRQVVRDHEVITLDRTGAAARLAEAQARMEAGVAERDYAGRGSRDIAPLSLPEMP